MPDRRPSGEAAPLGVGLIVADDNQIVLHAFLNAALADAVCSIEEQVIGKSIDLLQIVAVFTAVQKILAHALIADEIVGGRFD